MSTIHTIYTIVYSYIYSYIYHAMPWVKVKLATENMLLQSRPVGNGDVSSPAEEEVRTLLTGAGLFDDMNTVTVH